MKVFRRWLRWLSVLGLLMLCWRPATGLAESTRQLDAIRERMETGLALFVGGKAEQAAQQFEAGYAEYPYPAFLFNAGVCYEKLGRPVDALAKYKLYLTEDPNSPDLQDVQRRVARLEQELGSGTGLPPPPPPAADVDQESMRSLVVIESDPPGAPVRVFRPKNEQAAAYRRDQPNPGWDEVVSTTSPTSLSLSVGMYHIVIDKFADFNASDTQLRVSPGHVHHFKANLSQGVFMAFLRVSSNVKGAHIWLDHKDTTKPEWGTTPYAELVPIGEHKVFIEAPGFEPASAKVQLESGERREVQLELTRVGYGFIHVDAADAPEAVVSLDGRVQGTWRKGGPPLQVRANAGEHTLLVESDGRKDFEGRVTVPRGQILPVSVRMIPKYPRGAAWAQAAISAALIGGGVYLGSESETLRERLQQERQQGSLQSDDTRITKGKWFAIGADVAFAGGAVLAGLATWNFVKDPLPESSLTPAPAQEFPDPLASKPTALLPVRKPRAVRLAQAPKPWSFKVNPIAAPDCIGLGVGGRF